MNWFVVGAAVVGLLAVASWYAAAVVLGRALLTYSRSRLEELLERRSMPDRVDEIEAEWEHAERSQVVHATAATLASMALLGVSALGIGEPSIAPWWVVGWLVVWLLVRVASGVVGRVFAEAILARFWPLARVLTRIAAPMLAIGNAIEHQAQRRGLPRRSARPRPASVEVEYRQRRPQSGDDPDPELSEATRQRLERVIALEHRDVAEVMTPRSSVILLPIDTAPREIARILVGSGHSRIPLYKDDRDDIVGILYAKDLLAELVGGTPLDEVRIAGLLRPPFRIPETKGASDLLDEMKLRRIHIAIVVDEYGGVAGLIALEDLIESIVGSIDDEHDIPKLEEGIVTVGEGLFEVNASMSLETLNERLELDLPTDADYQTIGGFAFNALARLPEPGATFHERGIEFTVIDVVDHSIRRVRIDLNPRASLERSIG